jgi:hypothetical protein
VVAADAGGRAPWRAARQGSQRVPEFARANSGTSADDSVRADLVDGDRQNEQHRDRQEQSGGDLKNEFQ